MGGLRLIATFGWLLATGAAMAALTAAVAFASDDRQGASILLATAGVMTFVAAALVFAFRGRSAPSRRRHGLALILAAWIVLPAFASLPFMAIVGTGFPAAYFESVSAFTTTGATAIEAIDPLPRGLVFWRAALQWMGGGLTILLAAAAFDISRATGQGGVQLLSSGVAHTGRLAASARAVLPLYALATLVCLAALVVAGIPEFDAACLALSTLSTGGAVPHDGEIADYQAPAAALVLCVFMVLGATNFMALAGLRTRGTRSRAATGSLWRIAIAAALIVLFLTAVFTFDRSAPGIPAHAAALEAVFATVSLATTTGFVHDSEIAAAIPLTLAIALALVGGAYGSTAGGMKISRVARMLGAAGRELDILVHPSSVAPGDTGRRETTEPQRILWSYLIVYLLALVLAAAVLAAAGLGFSQALLGAAGAVANVGPILGIAGDGASAAAVYAGLSDGIKTVLALTMVLGRVEILAVLSLATPLFWTR